MSPSPGESSALQCNFVVGNKNVIAEMKQSSGVEIGGRKGEKLLLIEVRMPKTVGPTGDEFDVYQYFISSSGTVKARAWTAKDSYFGTSKIQGAGDAGFLPNVDEVYFKLLPSNKVPPTLSPEIMKGLKKENRSYPKANARSYDCLCDNNL